MFLRLFRQARESLKKRLAGAIYKEKKKEKRRQKELLTTWECLNYLKSSQQLQSCVIATTDSLFCKMFSPISRFEQEKALKNFSKKLHTTKIRKKKKEAETKSSAWDLKNA